MHLASFHGRCWVLRVASHQDDRGRWSKPFWQLHEVEPADEDLAEGYLGGVGPLGPGRVLCSKRAHRRARLLADWLIRTQRAGTSFGNGQDLLALARADGVTT
uniref:hypothetical protein n=1 Tax=Amycolatopsis sp. CA-151526 TaxID=3239921 RepID=UPI003F498898